ncbi:ABC transporter ATP-binding protein [Paenibacillus alvei]|uniref:ABC transporter ATP-binding protein n=1 Tax=Paenibacillus alvei TaxID=44250 RepID=A0AAP7A258_PAEAL|nr:ABC transporter ATP-binding protein [Paenibacillus alvei]NOJ73109.1 ABC transporter ATP-binding protein [Paenibacillus alvei]
MQNKNNILYSHLKLNKIKVCFIIVISIILGILEVYIPMFTQKIIDNGILVNDIGYVVKAAFLLIMFCLINSLMNGYLNILFAKTSIKIISDIKKDIYSNLLSYPVSFFDEHKTGYIMSRIEEVNSLNSLFSPAIVNYFKSVFSFVGALIVIIYIKWELLVLSSLLIPFYILITKKTSKQLMKSSRELNETAAEVSGDINENIRGVEELKRLNLEDKKKNDINQSVDQIAKLSLMRNAFTILGSESISFFLMLSRAIFIIVIGYYIINGELTIGSFFSLLTYTTNLFKPIQLHSSIIISLQPALVSLSRINLFFSKEVDWLKDGIQTINKISKIEFKNVTFTYPNSKIPVIKNLNFSIKEGEKLYIFGSNGTGKTTITKLITGLYSNYSGQILINGIDLRSICMDSYRKKIGVISQNAYLFSGNILDNIKLWDDSITIDDIEKITKQYNITNFLYDNKFRNRSIAELGKNLSGGQIQEIALTRAILRKPSLYIFDEPTSNLDADKKENFINVINKIKKEICITITHDRDLLKNIVGEENKTIELHSC